MDKRPLSPSTRQWLLDEVQLWRGAGLVSADQADAILDLYETPTQSSARQQSVAIYMLVGVAAMFVGLAALLCVGYNWDAFPDPFKLLVLLVAVGGVHGLGFYLRYVRRAKIFSEFAFFLGCLLYGGAIMLIAEIFQLGKYPPDGVWWWAIGVLPLAMFLDTVLLHLLAVALLASWLCMELTDAGFRDLRPDGSMHFCLTLPILAGLGLAWGYRKKSLTAVGFYVPLVAWWLIFLPFAWQFRENPILAIGGVGALLLIVAEIHPEGSHFAIPFRFCGACACMGVLSVLSFYDAQFDFVRIDRGNLLLFVGQSMLIALLSVGAFGIGLAMQYRRAEASYVRPMRAFAIRQWLPLSMAALMLLMAFWYAVAIALRADNDRLVPIVPMVAANVAMVVLAFWLMMLGLRSERGLPAAAGVLFFLLWSILRYAEWFGNLGGMLGAACMFFVCGAAIFAFAMFWHQRKKRHEESHHELERE